jgi:hypothetical protein
MTFLRFELRPFGFRTVSVTVNLPAFGKTYIGFSTLELAPVLPNFQVHVAGDPLERSVKYTGSPGRGDCGVHAKFARGNPQESGGVGVGVGGTVAAGVGVGVAAGGTDVATAVGVGVGVGGTEVGVRVGVLVAVGGTPVGVRVGVGVGGTEVGVRVGVLVAVGGTPVGVRVGVGGTGVGVRVGVGVAAGRTVVGVRVAVGGGGVGVGVPAEASGRTTNTANSGPVRAGLGHPTGVATKRPVIGSVTEPPA